MAELRIWCSEHNTVHQVVSLPGVTTMGYGALHVAEALGYAPEDCRWKLVEAPSGKPIPDSDIASDWDGRTVYLAVEQTR